MIANHDNSMLTVVGAHGVVLVEIDQMHTESQGDDFIAPGTTLSFAMPGDLVDLNTGTIFRNEPVEYAKAALSGLVEGGAMRVRRATPAAIRTSRWTVRSRCGSRRSRRAAAFSTSRASAITADEPDTARSGDRAAILNQEKTWKTSLTQCRPSRPAASTSRCRRTPTARPTSCRRSVTAIPARGRRSICRPACMRTSSRGCWR
ncbi:hypothetical protein [Burkholderia sp. Bp9143]|uniref:hypothetical protein n=1 Tax=Burkholderia sp. Bp9143 TaxID=2184574 RepID=UPI0021AB8F7B|nr:hypothetical protein [Burkholderia sp. Bp9143]